MQTTGFGHTVKIVATIAYTSRAVTLSDATSFPNTDVVLELRAFLWSAYSHQRMPVPPAKHHTSAASAVET